MPIVMGTAGHIDHGKTTLVKALTGIDCDRLSEEKKRGITIELGFAHLDLPGGERLGIVDVPGHEKFVRNMVAGAQGIDFVMLVIAADEGVMPQTREHLEICQLLGVKTGLVALNKADLVDEDWLDMVREVLGETLTGTFLEDAPVVPVSAHTGQGLDELRAALAKMAGSIRPRSASDLLRLPVDRVFTMKGHGTVITGTLISGTMNVGDEVVAYPGEKTGKVRSIQNHGQDLNSASAGMRTAVNLQRLDVADLHRGDMLARSGTLFPSKAWDVELTCLSSSPRSLKHRREVHFHHASREVLARLYFYDRDELKPGETALCRVRFNAPLDGVHGDHVVVRSFSPLRTIAGGTILNPLERAIKRTGPGVTHLQAIADGDPAQRVAGHAALAGKTGVSFDELRVLCSLTVKELDTTLNQLGGKQMVLLFDKEGRRYVYGEVVEELCASGTEFLEKFHKREPMKPGVVRGEFVSGWGAKLDPRLAHFIATRMVKNGQAEAEGDILRKPGYVVSLAADQATLRSELVSAYEKGGVAPMNLKQILEPLDVELADALPVVRRLTEEGLLVKITDKMYFYAPALDEVRQKTVAHLREAGEMDPGSFREATGLSRKYAIALLEHFDKEKLTVRVGDKRQLRKK